MGTNYNDALIPSIIFHATRYDKRPVTHKRLLSYESSDHVFLLARIRIVNDVRSALESDCSILRCTKSFYFHCIIFFDFEESQGTCLACTSLYTSVSSSSILCSKLFFSIGSLKMFHTSVGGSLQEQAWGQNFLQAFHCVSREHLLRGHECIKSERPCFSLVSRGGLAFRPLVSAGVIRFLFMWKMLW